MIDTFWFYVLAIILGFIIGGFVVAGIYLIFDSLNQKKFKKRFPNDNEVLLNPGKPSEINIKEVAEDDRRKFEKYREFEKLRRTEKAERGSDIKKQLPRRNIGESISSNVSNKDVDGTKKTQSTSRKSIELD